ncbi:MAG: hypothetical protein ACLVI6_01405 [Bifidobacterium bifidum]
MNQNSTDESNDFGDADDWMMAMRRLSEQLLYGLDSLTAKPDAQSLNNLLFIASLQSGVSIEPGVKSLLDTDEIRLLAPAGCASCAMRPTRLQVEASMVRQGQQGTPCTQIHAAAGHALRAMEPVLALAATRTGGDQL